MRAVVQRVRWAKVSVDGTESSSIGPGLLVLLGVRAGDGAELARRMGAKVAALRVFDDDLGRMNRSVADAGGEVLCVSQFTLYGNARRGNRPSYDEAAPAAEALPVYEAFCDAVAAAGLRCARGEFGAEMQVELLNDGPVTLIIDSDELERPRGA